VKLGQAFKMAFKSISGNKGRSFLTMLGIIIGVASVMTIVSVLMGMNQKTMEMYKAQGDNKITVYASMNNGTSIFDDIYDYCLYLRTEGLVDGVTPNANLWDITVSYGTKSSTSMDYTPNVYLGSDQYSVVNNFQIAKGRDLSKIDIDEYNNVCVMGSKAAQNFFDFTDPVGKELSINGIPFTVVGVYQEKLPDNNWIDNVIILPYTASRTLGQQNDMSQVYVRASSAENITVVTTYLIGFLTGICGDPMDWQHQKGWFDVYSEQQWIDQDNQMATMLSLVLGGIAAISLLVGGIGIMNIMLVTVTERTREIGIRRAIGAERKSIVAQFLIEAGMICGIGGLFGVALGTILTLVGSKLLLQELIWPSVGITVGALAFSVALGIIFGMYPAIKASGLQPVEALRAE